MKEIKAYAFSTSVYEAWKILIKGGKNGKKILKEIKDMPGFLGVHTSEDFVAYLFETPEQRLNAFNLAKKYFNTIAMMVQVAYIDADFVKQNLN